MLVLVGVLGFPLLFDTQPRPIAVDIPIEIPSRNQTTAVAPAPAKAPVAAEPKTVRSSVSTAESLSAREEVVAEAPAPVKPAVAPKVEAVKPEPEKAEKLEKPAVVAKTPEKSVEKVSEKPADRVVEKPAVKPVDKAADKAAEKADTKPEGANERIVVQVGAFAEVLRAREARMKLERAGMKTYTHVAELPEGRRIRVRVGPFATRAEADKAAARAKALGLQATLLWL